MRRRAEQGDHHGCANSTHGDGGRVAGVTIAVSVSGYT
jgi:hypothetical protein